MRMQTVLQFDITCASFQDMTLHIVPNKKPRVINFILNDKQGGSFMKVHFIFHRLAGAVFMYSEGKVMSQATQILVCGLRFQSGFVAFGCCGKAFQ